MAQSLSSQLKSKLQGLIVFLKESEQQLQVQTSTTLIGAASQRIFNNQSGSKNAADESLGLYSEAYKKQKTKKYGAALSQKVNLYASGTLYGSVKQVESNGDVYVAVTDVKYPKGQSTVEVSNYLDKQYGQTFAPTKGELKAVKESAIKFISKKTNEYFNR